MSVYLLLYVLATVGGLCMGADHVEVVFDGKLLTMKTDETSDQSVTHLLQQLQLYQVCGMKQEKCDLSHSYCDPMGSCYPCSHICTSRDDYRMDRACLHQCKGNPFIMAYSLKHIVKLITWTRL